MSRWNQEEDKPLSYEEFLEMKIQFDRDVKMYQRRWDAGDRSFIYKHQRRTVSRRELRYLEWLEKSVDDMF